MLPTNLNTNQVKNSAGTEVEYLFHKEEGRTREYAKSGESPALKSRLLFQHQTVGKEGAFSQLRRSNFSTKEYVISDRDNLTAVPITASTTFTVPEGALLSLNAAKDVLAKHISCLASDGTDTTVKFACTGTAAEALLNGSL